MRPLSPFQDENAGTRNFRIAIAAVLGIALFVGAAYFLLDSSSSPEVAQSSATTVPPDSTTAFTAPPTTAAPTTVTGPNGLNSGTDAEGNVFTAQQLAAAFPRDPDLSQALFDQSVGEASAFVQADATGQGQDRFGEYYDLVGLKAAWVTNFQLTYATAEAVNRSEIKATVWFSGTAKRNNSPLTQVRQIVYFTHQGTNLTIMNPADIEGGGTEPPGYERHIVQ